jgi:hypothetical protein
VNNQQRFHIEPLLILDPINWGPAFGLKSLGKISFTTHVASAGPPRKRLEHMLQLPGPHHRRCRRHARTPSPPPPPCWDLFDTTATAPSSTLSSERHRPHLTVLHCLPYMNGRRSPCGPRLLHSRPSLPRHQRLLRPQPGPLPVKQRALVPQASI